MPSTSDLSSLPDIEELRHHMQRLAALSAIFSVELGEPQFIFNPRWGKHQQVATNINGSGDELFIHFTRQGCFIKGFAHESEMTPYKRSDHSIWPGVLDSVPVEFASSLKEPAFDPAATTFAIWRLAADEQWTTGNVTFPPGDYKDGSADLLAPVTFSALEFTEWLSENYETDVDIEIVESVFAGHGRRACTESCPEHAGHGRRACTHPLTDEEMLKLNPSTPLHAIRDAVRATGYPIQEG